VNEHLSLAIGNVALAIQRPAWASPSRTSKALILTALLRDDAGNEGFGYSNFLRPEHLDGGTEAAIALAEKAGTHLSALLNIERVEEGLFGANSDARSKSAANAISLAAWDLAARRAGLPCSVLFGGHDAKLPCYGSGYFLAEPPGALEAEIEKYRNRNFHRVKMRVCLGTLENDLERLKRLQDIFGPGNVAVDARETCSPERVMEFMDRISAPIMWFEDPTPFDQLDKIRAGLPLTSGETLTTRDEFLALVEKGVRKIIVDLANVGGPVRFLEIARALTAMGCEVAAHTFPYYAVHLLTCFPNNAPVELLDWWDPLFLDRPSPDAEGNLTQAGPGFGVKPDHKFLAEHGRVIRTFSV